MTTATKAAPKKPARAKKSKPTPTPQEEALLAIGRASEEVNRHWYRVRQAEEEKDEASEILKGAKADHLEAVKRLQETITEWTQPNLFNQAAKPSTNGHAAPTEQPDAWKSEPLSVLVKLGGLTQSDLERIQSKTELKTMGDLSKWLTDERHNFVDLPGIGKSKVEKLEDAMEKFWKEHPAASATPAAVVEDVAKATELPAAEEAK